MYPENHTINYIEFPLVDNEKTKAFYGGLFGWIFTDWGPDYLSFNGAGVEGGFHRNDQAPVREPGVLVVLYARDLEVIEGRIRAAGGKIIQPIYGFPGGRRFHFQDPNGNELAVWSQT